MIASILLIFVCLVLGFLLRISGKMPQNTPHVLNAFVIWVSLPALVLFEIPVFLSQNTIDQHLLIPISMAWVQFIVAFCLFYFLGKHLQWPRTVIGALILTAGLGNTGFVGYPVIESLFGQEGLRLAVIADQAGTFIVLSILGVIIASIFSPLDGREVSVQSILKHLFTFPPFVALLVAIIWFATGMHGAKVVTKTLEKLAGTMTPLALVAVGFQLKISKDLILKQWKFVGCGLVYKLILVPLICIFLYEFLCHAHDLTARVTILQSAMAPMVTASVLAEEFGLNTEVANLMVGIGIPLSLITVLIWNQLLKVFL